MIHQSTWICLTPFGQLTDRQCCKLCLSAMRNVLQVCNVCLRFFSPSALFEIGIVVSTFWEEKWGEY